MSSFVIKLIAIITMLCDHSSDTFIGHLSFFNIIGRIAFPLFCFQLVIGYNHTKDVKKYLIRLIIFAFISQIPFGLFMYNFIGSFNMLNIFFTLSLGLIAIYALDKFPNKIIAIILDIAIMFFAEFIKVDYGWFGIVLILCIFIFYKDKYTCKSREFLSNIKNNILFAIIFFTLCFIKYYSYFGLLSNYIVWAEILGTFFPIIFMLLYNGKKGPNIKYFFYFFYPAHLLILVLFKILLLT